MCERRVVEIVQIVEVYLRHRPEELVSNESDRM